VVVSESIRFRKSLPNFKFFTIVTQVDSLDERDFYISQKFFYQNELYAEGFIKGRFRKRGQKSSISTEEIFAFAGLPRPSLLKSAKANAQIHTEELLAQSGS
jgi:acyl-CoA thioesterase FadM